mgnify:CR=1 FL=1
MHVIGKCMIYTTVEKKKDFERRYSKVLNEKGLKVKSADCDLPEIRGEAEVVCELTLEGGEKTRHKVKVKPGSLEWKTIDAATAGSGAAKPAGSGAPPK